MNIALWVVQGLLAIVFVMAGFMKIATPYSNFKDNMAWTGDFKPGTIKLIGILEILGGVGLVFPMLFNVLPILTPIAAADLALVMLLAGIVHLRRKERKELLGNLVLFILSLFVAIGRFL